MKKKNHDVSDAYVLRPDERLWTDDEVRGRAHWDRKGQRLKQAIEWLSPQASWDTTIMGSHRDTVSVGVMRKLVLKFHSAHMKGCPLVYGIELHPGGHGAHWHGAAQIGHRAQSESERVQLRTDLWEKWFDLYGRASFWPPRSAQNVIGYALKDSVGEAIKDGDWGILGFTLGADTTKLGRAFERRAFRFRQSLSASLTPRCERDSGTRSSAENFRDGV
jgi:hypothetical protein